ncbi:glycosyl hydrolase [Siculibacillus lacustris]|uniref:Glycosyl hydrolase n=1 Tax=Siculibacillus lacustris TaxID=1549641 RepID=A0A4Q9VLD7_9HYPH|nr:glycoside hydrolase family 3 N-terminal domain-containing protein [Siculibacillus lacustris]TBW36283.1 glycosyl hydrolase [Siculibacillus lacustris]
MVRFLRPLSLLLALLPAIAGAGEAPVAPPRDARIEAEIAALLARMTLEEKVGQMYMGGWSPDFDLSEVTSSSIGALSGPPDAPTIASIAATARRTRLGIPLLFTQDMIHGYRTLFPMPLGLAASFDPRVIAAAAEGTAREAAAQGMHLALGPMVDLSRDPRWGRVVEGPGEDVFLSRLFAEATVRGLAKGGLAATLKHFVGYGAAEAGREYAATWIPDVQLRDVYLPAFHAGLSAGAPMVMAAFNALNGIPVTANRFALTTLLKGEWGFDGFVVSDWDSVSELKAHGLAATDSDAVALAVNAGLDVEMAGRLFPRLLPDLVRAGRVPMARIDDAVTRVLRVKHRLGLFDATRPAIDPAAATAALATPATREIAREVARRSVVLLKNDADRLPLVAPPPRIAVIGAAAADAGDHMGAWGAAGRREDVPLLLDQLRDRLAGRSEVTFSAPCDDACRSTDGFDAAVATAAASDLVIAVLGEPWWMTAEATSRTRLGLPNHQEELLTRLAATGKPIVLVVIAGRPMVLTETLPKVAAILWTFSPGTMGGAALADLLLGEASPSARLPMSLPRAVGQVPISYDQLPSGRPTGPDLLTSRYLDEEASPLFPFGYGLTYTRFAHRDLRVVADRLRLADTLAVAVTVANVGSRPGREIVQLYVHDLVASRSRPLRQLAALAIVDLAPGESREVTLSVPVADLAFHDDAGRRIVEPGVFRVFVGGSSDATLSADVTVVEGTPSP